MKLRIRSKLILIVLSIVVPLIAFVAFSYNTMIKSIRQQSAWKIRLTAEEVSRELGDHFDMTFNVIDALVQHPAVKKMDTAACDSLFAKLLPSYPLYLNILTANPDGFNVGSGVDPQKAHELNYNDKDWFQLALSGKRVVADLHTSKLFKIPSIMMAAPVYSNNSSLKGVIGFPLSLDELSKKLVRDWKLPPQSIIIVADAKGNLLVDTEHKDHVGKNLAHLPLLQTAKKTVNGFIEMPASDGIKRLYYVTTPNNTEWRVVVGVPSASFIKEAMTFNNPFLFAIIAAAILGLILAILIGRRLSSTVALIVEGIKSIGGGNLGSRLNLKGSDELADIAGYFNEMAATHQQYRREINDMNTQLELRVEERTAKLAAANKELDSFSYSVSHDLSAPLRHITGFSNILLEGYGDKLGTEGQKCLDRIQLSCNRMKVLIDDLLEFSHISRAVLHKQSVNLGEMALQIAEDLRQSEPERDIELKISSAVMADADPVLIRTVLENLIGNAWKFTKRTEKPVITFDAKRENGSTTYFVSDNGAGFNQAYVGQLFIAFHRLHSSSEFEGSGIGLVSVQKIINRHGGKIWAEGKEGEGATFYFTVQ